MNIAIVGATGMVGRTMLQVMEERNIQCTTLIPVASEKSKGTPIIYQGKTYITTTIEEALKLKIDYALFSAGGDTSLAWAEKFAAIGAVVIDNSSAWRMHPDVPLVVPQINAAQVQNHKIIANPNCSTIQLVMAIGPLHKKFGIKRMIVSTYQSVTGTGKAAVEQMMQEREKGKADSMVYHYPIDMNCIPHCDVFLDNGYTKEEMKVVNETRKILDDSNIAITTTAVRVPVVGGHSESVNIEFTKDITLEGIKSVLSNISGVIVQDNPAANEYPMPLTSHGRDEVFVGRIRMDESLPNTVNMWITADNLRKGAATNAVEIMEFLINKKQ